jgi:ribosomal protein S19E (S16A)
MEEVTDGVESISIAKRKILEARKQDGAIEKEENKKTITKLSHNLVESAMNEVLEQVVALKTPRGHK